MKPGLTYRETGTVLAALRFWQHSADSMKPQPIQDIATDSGAFPALKDDEVDELIELLNSAKRTNWERNEFQFPRLLAEIYAAGLSLETWDRLAESMDLENGHIDELFSRAQEEWEKIKQETCPINPPKPRYEVSLPNTSGHGSSMVSYTTFDTRDEAVAFARKEFGADGDGFLGLVNRIPE